MAVTRAKKIEQVEQLSGELEKVSSVVVATFGKLTVAQDFELRKALRASGARHHAVQGRDLLQAPVPDQCSGAAPGYSRECHRARFGGGDQPGSGEAEIQGSVEDW